MPQSERNRRVAFRWEQVMEAVLRMTNLFEEFILKIMSSQFNLAVGKSSIVWEGYWMQNNAKSSKIRLVAHTVIQSCCPRGLALASRILEDTIWRSWPWPWPRRARPWPWPW